MKDPVRVGLIGCGTIAPVYLEAARRFTAFTIVACADQARSRAEQAAATYAIPSVLEPRELVARSDIELVLVLTPPPSHAELLGAALASGKHAYSEKPIALDLEGARGLIAAAESAGLALGCAPDTVLGAGVQTTRKLIDDGWIGRPVSATAFMQCPGHESWHPDPAFYYAAGGGPLFDMGPYYVTALVTLLGPVESVCAMADAACTERIATSEARYGERIPVSVPTHVDGVLRFASGVIATLVMSFDVVGHSLPHLEIHGTDGSLSAPDPNTFGGPVQVKRRGAEDFEPVPLTHAYATESRGLGVADMAQAIRAGGQPRASGQLALHVLACMEALHHSAAAKAFVSVAVPGERPEPMPMGLLDGRTTL